MVENKIVGTYWYVINNGKRYITQGNKPVLTLAGYFRRSGEGMSWLCLDTPDYAEKDGEDITNTDYLGIDFPDIPPETPVEIEIVKSGKVYVYES